MLAKILIITLLFIVIIFCNIDVLLVSVLLIGVCYLISNYYDYTSDNTVFGGKESKIHYPKLKSFRISDKCKRNMTFNGDTMQKNIIELFEKNKTPHLSHLQEDTKFSDKFSRILQNDSETLEYKHRYTAFKTNLHWGQLKLMLTEIEFLSLILQQYKIDKSNKPIYMIYAGAAPGQHIVYLSHLFPTINFELYDPNDFAISDTEKIKTHVQFFTNVDAEHWKDESDKKYVVFCSDIRTEPAIDENIIKNMEMQLEWWKIINPNLSMFKFRLPWKEGETEYPEGDIYIQPFPGPTSTETRLICKKNAKIITYNNKKYESQMFHHNIIGRYKKYHCILGNNLSIEKDSIDNCYDCISFVSIIELYLQNTGWKNTDSGYKKEIKRLILDIQDNITFGKHDIKSQTINSLNNSLENLYSIYCHGKPIVARNNMKSRATLESTQLAIEKANREKANRTKNITDLSEERLCGVTGKHVEFIDDGDHYDKTESQLIKELKTTL